MQPSHVFLILGGLEGEDGWVDSAGMLGLRDQLVAAGFVVSVFTWDHSQHVDAPIATWSTTPGALTIVIGFSGGAARATWLHQPIDLLIGYDPSPAWWVRPIHNVKKAICYHNNHPAMWVPFIGWLGGGQYEGPQVMTYEINGGKGEWHMAVQFDNDLHNKTVAACQALVA